MSLEATLMQQLRTRYSTAVDKNEHRASQYGAFDVFAKQTNGAETIITPELKAKAAASFGNTVAAPVLNAPNVTLSNVRSCVIPDFENESALMQLTFATYAFGFTMIPSQYKNNEIGYQDDWSRKMNAYILKLAATLDSAAIARLNTDKNQAWNAEITNAYSQVGNVLQVPMAGRDDFYNHLPSINAIMDYYGTSVDVVANTMHRPIIRKMAAQGAGNSVNTEFQFAGHNYAYSNRVSNAVGVHSTVYAVQPGSVGFVTRIDPDCEAGNTIGDVKRWGKTTLPLLGLEVGTFYTKDCSDKSAMHLGTVDLKRTLVEGFEFSFDIAWVSAYNSDIVTRHQPILKAEFLTT